MTSRFIIAPYDATTRKGGTANVADLWRAMKPNKNVVEYERYLGPLIPPLVGFEVHSAYRYRQIPFTLGGDHSLTYHALKAVVSCYGPVNVVHFDAHHDAYPQTQINHFTVFHHIKKRLPVTVFPVGHRYQIKAGESELIQFVEGYTYISVDVDYFDPSLVASVVHPVASADEHRPCNLESFARSLDRIVGQVVGIDLVEWMGSPSDSEEYQFIKQVLSLLSAKGN